MIGQRKSAELRDSHKEELIETRGVVVIPGIIPQKEVALLKNIYDRLHVDKSNANDMWNSLYDLPDGEGMRVSAIIQQAIEPYIEAQFKRMKVMVYTFMVKNRGQNTFCQLHRDYSAFDEDVFEYRNGWIPLVDVDETNGALMVVPHSHHVFKYCLPMFTEWPYRNMLDDLMKYVEVVHAKAGDLVIYTDRTLHGSERNMGGQTRPVVHFGLLHPDAELSYYHLNQEKKEVEIYSVNPDFYFGKDYQAALQNKPVAKRFAYNPPGLKFSEIKGQL